MARRWKHSITVYLTEKEYLLIADKVSELETTGSGFAKQALKIYINHLESHPQDRPSQRCELLARGGRPSTKKVKTTP